MKKLTMYSVVVTILLVAIPMVSYAETGGETYSAGGTNEAYEGMEWEGYLSDQKEKFVIVVVNKVEWDELWKRAFDKPAPEVDFEKYAVACVFLGHSADWLYNIGFDKPYQRDNLLVIPFGLAEIILKLSGPFKASGQYHMKVFKKQKGVEMVLEDTSRYLRRI